MFGVASPGSRHRHQWGEGGHEWSELYQAQGHHQPVSKTNLPAAASRSLVVSKFPPCSCGVFSFVSPSPLAPWGSLMTHTSSASFLHLCLLGCSPKSPPPIAPAPPQSTRFFTLHQVSWLGNLGSQHVSRVLSEFTGPAIHPKETEGGKEGFDLATFLAGILRIWDPSVRHLPPAIPLSP